MLLVLIAGSTRTARIDGISAAGATPALTAHTPGADLEVVEYGRPVRSPVVPVSPSGCPTPAVVTRAVRELVGVETLALDAGLGGPTAADTASVATATGGDVRHADPVPDAASVMAAAREVGGAADGDELLVGESIPGGTTTALGVLRALGERPTVSSSRAENPLDKKRAVVADGLAASEVSPGGASGQPIRAVRRMGDPVLAAATGVILGALDAGATVTLAGGTQMAAVAALVRHAGCDDPLRIATTSFVADDESAGLDALAADLGVETTVTDPGFDRGDHPALEAYCRGEGKEGVGMGGALAVAARRGVGMNEVRERAVDVADRVAARAGVEA